MGIEGGSRGYGIGFTRRRNPEDPYGRGIEPRGDNGPEDTAEREPSYWLGRLVNPEMVERARSYPACEGWSTEYHIYQRLLGVLVETGPEMNPVVRARLRNLVGTLRVAMFPNLKPNEQQSLRELASATTFDMSSLQYEITPEVSQDIQWIWTTFGLRIPDFQDHVGPAETTITALLSQSAN